MDFAETRTHRRMHYVYRSLPSSSIAVHGIFVPYFSRARAGYGGILVSSPADVGWPWQIGRCWKSASSAKGVFTALGRDTAGIVVI